MELRHLRYFVAVAEALSFTKAAENLHLAQPSLTRQIKDLEAEIGVRLFDRSGKRISLTQEGESFLLDARRLLDECAQSVQAVQRLSRGEASQLNIGYIANIYHDLLPVTLGTFRRACPRTALNLFDMTPASNTKPSMSTRLIWVLFVSEHAQSAGISTGKVSVTTCSWSRRQQEVPLPKKPKSISRIWKRCFLLECLRRPILAPTTG